MTDTIKLIGLPTRTLIMTGLIMSFGLGLVMLIPQVARAESPNILVGPDLTVGSTGQGVVVLQGLMTELGYLNVPSGVAFGYFGPMTQAAVARYQTSLNITPAAGYYGPVTKIAMRDHFASRGWLQLLSW